MIINSLLDTDLYKFKMSNFVSQTEFKEYNVCYKFENRSNINLLNHISIKELNKEIDHLLKLKFNYSELEYLNSLGYFSENWINSMCTAVPNSLVRVNIRSSNSGRLKISLYGPWMLAILYESAILAIINELYNKSINKLIDKNLSNEYYKLNLQNKINILKQKENKNIKFIEFGTRRRHSHQVQNYVISYLSELKNNIIGTSNVYFAKKYNLKPVGTMAHELPMFYVAEHLNRISESKNIKLSIINNQIVLMKNYFKMYPDTHWLTDTFGTEWFLKYVDFSRYEYDYPKIGLRHDSGCPFEFTDSIINRYGKIKSIMFSDNLDLDKIIALNNHCKKYNNIENVSFGWGTNLTNDGVIKPISIVMKLSEFYIENKCVHTVKLSDNPEKIHAFNNEDIEIYKKIFEYRD